MLRRGARGGKRSGPDWSIHTDGANGEDPLLALPGPCGPPRSDHERARGSIRRGHRVSGGFEAGHQGAKRGPFRPLPDTSRTVCDKAPTRLVAGAEDSDMPLLSFAHFGPPLQYGWMAQNPSVLNHPSPAPLARSSPFGRTTRPTRLSRLENEAVGRFRCTCWFRGYDGWRPACEHTASQLNARSQRQPSVSDARQRCKGRRRSFLQTR
jgi:hypothetical protein